MGCRRRRLKDAQVALKWQFHFLGKGISKGLIFFCQFTRQGRKNVWKEFHSVPSILLLLQTLLEAIEWRRVRDGWAKAHSYLTMTSFRGKRTHARLQEITCTRFQFAERVTQMTLVLLAFRCSCMYVPPPSPALLLLLCCIVCRGDNCSRYWICDQIDLVTDDTRRHKGRILAFYQPRLFSKRNPGRGDSESCQLWSSVDRRLELNNDFRKSEETGSSSSELITMVLRTGGDHHGDDDDGLVVNGSPVTIHYDGWLRFPMKQFLSSCRVDVSL